LFFHSKQVGILQNITKFLCGISPFILFSLISLIYYGFIFPNTAYAKLNLSTSQEELWRNGFSYLFVSLEFDPLLVSIIIFSMFCILLGKSPIHFKVACLGSALYLCYVLKIGGDFMQGRFFSCTFIFSTLLLLGWIKKIPNLVFPALIIFALLWNHTPLNTGINYQVEFLDNELINNVQDERGYRFQQVSIYAYIAHLFENTSNPFPYNYQCMQGIKFKNESSSKVTIYDTLGYYGYCSGLEKIIIDPLGLSDPLLARLKPIRSQGSAGHFPRKIPDGYIQSIEKKQNLLRPSSKEYNLYNDILLITRSEKLFTKERWHAILRQHTQHF
jgi:arabinofuranosyltransferase